MDSLSNSYFDIQLEIAYEEHHSSFEEEESNENLEIAYEEQHSSFDEEESNENVKSDNIYR
jgi:hypothetical protein